MQLSHLLTAFVAATLVSGSPAAPAPVQELEESPDFTVQGCYGDGVKWADKKGAAISYAGQWCANGGAGKYIAGQTKYRCFNHDNGKKTEFWLQRKSASGTNLAQSSCNSYLQGAINACDRGGSGERDGWYHREVYLHHIMSSYLPSECEN